MKAYETSAIVAQNGELHLTGVPFSPGTEVNVVVNSQRLSAEEFQRTWERVCGELRTLPHLQEITDEEIQKEIADYRAGR